MLEYLIDSTYFRILDLVTNPLNKEAFQENNFYNRV